MILPAINAALNSTALVLLLGFDFTLCHLR
jgi:hypothetical protein